MKLTPRARALISEYQKRKSNGDILGDLHEGQKRFVFAKDDDGNLAKFVCLLSARRFGKTEGCLRYAGYLCTIKPRSRCVVVYQQVRDAREIAWPLLEDLHSRYGWEARLNSVEMAVRFANGSVIKLAGADDERRHRQFKGQRNDLFVVDEAQDWYSDLQRLVRWVTPGVADRRGRIFLCGTPGLLPEGFFYEVCRGDHREFVTVKGSPFENPHTREQLEEQLTQLRRANSEIEREPWIQREFFGRWVVDSRKNVVHVDPALNYLYEWQPEGDDQYIIGIDWGDDNAAFVVSTFNPRRYNWQVYLEAHEMRGMLINDHIALIRNLEAKYPGAVIVADPGGVSKGIVRELREVHGIPIINASKESRIAHIEFLNADLSLGTVKIFNRDDPAHPENSLIARQWRELVWIDDKMRGTRVESRPRDIHDACLYSRRYAAKHLYRKPEDKPKYGTQEWAAHQAKEMFERKANRYRKQLKKYGSIVYA